MAKEEKKETSYLKEVLTFYFAPELRSIGTLFYLGVYGYFVLFYIYNVFLALEFIIHIVFGKTVLMGTAFLFTSLLFLISLTVPFALSLYSIFVLHRIWDKPEWAVYVKWAITGVVIGGGIALIIVLDDLSRSVAREPSLQSFIEDANLTGRI